MQCSSTSTASWQMTRRLRSPLVDAAQQLAHAGTVHLDADELRVRGGGGHR
jgi:hypothetical protein